MGSSKAFDVLKKVLASKYAGKAYVKDAIVSGLYGREKDFKAALGASKDKKFMSMLDSVGKKIKIASNFKNLNKEEQRLFKKGEKQFNMICFGCHGPDAKGLPNVAPPLVNSEWVNGSKERLLTIMLCGLSGPIKVNGKTYKLPNPIMPGLGANPMFKDEDFAAIATFVRNHFGNKSGAVKPSEATAVRKATKGKGIFTVEELKDK
jgi:mono/diheme cytochrome c family protein